MTAAQLAHLAEQAASAADFYTTTNPSAARTFRDTARQAARLSERLRRDEELARLRVELTVVRDELGHEFVH